MKNLVNSTKVSNIGFYSSQMGAGINHGYGYASVQLIEAWQRLNIPVWTWDIDAPIGFNFIQPPWYEYVPGRANIGYTPWESTGIPEAWPHYMNQMTEVWTTCEANKQWFIEAGCKVPVRVLHHGINRSHWPSKRREVADSFRILVMGADSKRKGSRTAVEAFKAAFPNPVASGVELVLKGKPWWNFKESPGVTLIEDYYDHQQLTDLYHSCHAMVYPTNGEGFGLIPFDAMASGMPTFVTNWSGPEDFIEFGYPLHVKKLVKPDYEPHIGLWAEPDFDKIVYSMLCLVNNYEWYADDAYEKSIRMDKDWTWDALAKKSIGWMEEIIA